MLVVGTVFLAACGWLGGATPTPTPTGTSGPSTSLAPSPSPSPSGNATIISPAASPAVGASPSPSPAAGGGESYTVAEGDTLASIANKFYGDESQWRKIYDANRQAIGDNPDAVKVGTKLTIPPK
jgi:nucleoid-associated protein YgaU